MSNHYLNIAQICYVCSSRDMITCNHCGYLTAFIAVVLEYVKRLINLFYTNVFTISPRYKTIYVVLNHLELGENSTEDDMFKAEYL